MKLLGVVPTLYCWKVSTALEEGRHWLPAVWLTPQTPKDLGWQQVPAIELQSVEVTQVGLAVTVDWFRHCQV